MGFKQKALLLALLVLVAVCVALAPSVNKRIAQSRSRDAAIQAVEKLRQASASGERPSGALGREATVTEAAAYSQLGRLDSPTYFWDGGSETAEVLVSGEETAVSVTLQLKDSAYRVVGIREATPK